jgi:hypothetical protein
MILKTCFKKLRQYLYTFYVIEGNKFNKYDKIM